MAHKSYRLITWILVATLLAAIPGSGCSRKSGNKNICLGVVLRLSLNQYYVEMEKGIREAATKEGWKVAVLYPEKADSQEQIGLVETLIALKVNALLIAPEDSESIIPVIVKANSMNIPVILLDTALDEKKAKEQGARVECVVESENEKGGRLAADYLVRETGGKGRVIYMDGNPGNLAEISKKKGFLEEMKKHPQITIVTAPSAEYNRARAFEISRKLFNENPDITGAFAVNDIMALGIADAVALTGMKKVHIIGYNATAQGQRAIKDGLLDASVCQNPYNTGKAGAEMIMQFLAGKSIPPRIVVKTYLLTKENLSMPFQ